MIAAMADYNVNIDVENVSNSKINVMIIVFVATTFRNTFSIKDTNFYWRCTIYEAMIPHHSSAIMTSSNVDFKDQKLKN
jgi:hypothetical protein